MKWLRAEGVKPQNHNKTAAVLKNVCLQLTTVLMLAAAHAILTASGAVESFSNCQNEARGLGAELEHTTATNAKVQLWSFVNAKALYTCAASCAARARRRGRRPHPLEGKLSNIVLRADRRSYKAIYILPIPLVSSCMPSELDGRVLLLLPFLMWWRRNSKVAKLYSLFIIVQAVPQNG